MPIIETINLTKRYGQLLAISNLNLAVEEADCYGFIGPNGAGKTTTIRILSTLLQPTWGEARICGHVVGYESRQIRPLIGYVPDSFGAYEDMVVQEYLEFFAAAYGIAGKGRAQMVHDVLELTDLAYKRDALVNSLSRGMQQRLSLARVLLHNPRVLLLDEPASGLDPRARIEIRELLKELKRMGKTILISSHILHELSELCNKIGIIERGELIFSGTVQEAVRRGRSGTVLHVDVTCRAAEAAAILGRLRGVKQAVQQDAHIQVSMESELEDVSAIARALLEANIGIREIRPEPVNLETAFMRLTKGLVQ